MEKKNIKIIFILVFFTMTYFLFNVTMAKGDDKKFISGVLKSANSNLIEYGIKINFKGSQNQDKKIVCNGILNDLRKMLHGDIQTEVMEEGSSYCLNFNNCTDSGYIEGIEDGKNNEYILSVIRKTSENNIYDFESELFDCTRNFISHPEFSIYVKADIGNQRTSKIKDNVLNYLSKENSTNVDSVKMDDGYSIVGLTHCFRKVAYEGKKIDFNCAIMRYIGENGDKKNYLIIGAPELFVQY